MLKILFAGLIAMIGTLPSVLIARIYLSRRQIPIGAEGTVKTFMEVAPTPLKAVLISLNFLFAGILFTAVFVAIGLLSD